MSTPFAVCISGHRPEKLPQGNALRIIQSLLYQEIGSAIDDGAAVFYTGMARGTDLWAAEMILQFRQTCPQIRLVCVLPFAESVSRLRSVERYQAMTLMNAADETVTLSEHYYPGCYRARNAYMVSRSQRLIAVAADPASGTGQTIRMAERNGLEVRLISLAQSARYQNPEA
ncbi:MAG: DUF1273 domain-containing protein [Oscillospiraceae bacterium]|nr:DUF1273 domain-containing protein [Oscillospiraceae bacterium]